MKLVKNDNKIKYNSHSRDIPRYLWLTLGLPLMAAIFIGFVFPGPGCLSN